MEKIGAEEQSMPFRVVNGKDCTMVRSEGIKDVKKKPSAEEGIRWENGPGLLARTGIGKKNKR